MMSVEISKVGWDQVIDIGTWHSKASNREVDGINAPERIARAFIYGKGQHQEMTESYYV